MDTEGTDVDYEEIDLEPAALWERCRGDFRFQFDLLRLEHERHPDSGWRFPLHDDVQPQAKAALLGVYIGYLLGKGVL